jgi:hypothetical protein
MFARRTNPSLPPHNSNAPLPREGIKKKEKDTLK